MNTIRHGIILSVLALACLCAPQSAIAAKVRTERIEIPQTDDPAPKTGVPAIPPSAIEKPSPITDPVGDDAETAPSETSPEATEDGPDDQSATPVVHYGEDGLPDAVLRTRTEILEAAKTGIIENLRPVLESNEMPPTLSFSGIEDPIAYLKTVSGDAEGREMLAILTEILEAGWVHVEKGTAQEMYVWPYFAQYPLHKLSPQQFVELFKIVTAGDYEDMQAYGAYIFYRVGIGPDGTWHYFVAGD